MDQLAHDALVAALAAAGAWAAVRIELRLLWRFLRGLEQRIVRLENRALR